MSMHPTPFFCALITVLLLAGCAQQQKTTIEVRVLDLISGEPISGAEVTLQGTESGDRAGVTGTDGIIVFGFSGLKSDVYYDISVSAAGYSGETLADVLVIEGTLKPITVQLEPVQSKPIPEGRFYEDSVVVDMLPGTGKYSGEFYSVLVRTPLYGEGANPEAMLFSLQSYGAEVAVKRVLQGQDLRDVFVDGNREKVFSKTIVVRSLGYDTARQLSYADISFSR